jgi:hypothetical protein
MSLTNPGGTQVLTADGVVGVSGRPCRVYSITWTSGGSAGQVVLRNGTTASGAIFFDKLGVVSDTDTQNFQSGRFFPGGCFFDKDSNVTRVVVSFENEA